jgi:GAF domain-containing protein
MTTEKIDAILNTVHQRVQKLIPSDRFYVVLYDSKKGELSFPLVSERDKLLPKNQSPWTTRPCDPKGMLPDSVISRGVSSLYQTDFSTRLEQEQMRYWPGGELPRSWLGVPLNMGGQVIGALALENWGKSDAFSGNDEQILSTIARQTATAIENARLHQQLERKIENLRILNQVGQQLTRGLVKQENEILDLVYQSATTLQMDTRNMYIAFYDPGRQDTESEIFGTLRFPLAFDEGERTSIRDRPVRNGLTEHVIRAKQSFNPPDVAETYKELAQDQIGKIPCSWLGVPMLSEGQVFGVIVLRHNEMEQAYTQDDQEMLEILAGQAAVALQNLRLYQARQLELEKRMAAENMAVMSSVAAEFAHKMNNLAGTIPVRIKMAKGLLEPNNLRDVKITEQLTKIEAEADGILKAAEHIRQSSEKASDEQINVNQLLEIAVNRAQNTQTNKQNEVDIKPNFSDDLPLIMAERNSFLDMLTSIIKNGYEAIGDKGTIMITTCKTEFNRHDVIEIKIADTGKGIPASDLPKIFDLFYTTKGERGLGFGLWRDRIFIKKLGGEIDVQSIENTGSTFTIRIPIK